MKKNDQEEPTLSTMSQSSWLALTELEV